MKHLLLLGSLLLSLAVQAQEPFKILFLGDSLTEGYGLEQGESFPSLLQERFDAEGRNVEVVNAGISGSTSASALSRVQWYIRSEPDLLVLSLGANDGLRGLSVDELRANLSETIAYAQEHGLQVALTGMLIPPNYGPEYTEDFARTYPELAEEYDIPFMPFLLEDVAAVPDLNQGDGIHPNAEGTRIVADNVYEFLLPLLPGS